MNPLRNRSLDKSRCLSAHSGVQNVLSMPLQMLMWPLHILEMLPTKRSSLRKVNNASYAKKERGLHIYVDVKSSIYMYNHAKTELEKKLLPKNSL